MLMLPTVTGPFVVESTDTVYGPVPANTASAPATGQGESAVPSHQFAVRLLSQIPVPPRIPLPVSPGSHESVAAPEVAVLAKSAPATASIEEYRASETPRGRSWRARTADWADLARRSFRV